MTTLYWWLIGIVGVSVLLTGVWFFFFRSAPAEEPAVSEDGQILLTNTSQSVEVTPESPASNENQTENTAQPVAQKVFRVVNGPIVGATVVQMTRPTTTVARYIQQNNGHVFDLVLDSSGAVPKAISNTTIPGIIRVLWAQQGGVALLQYLDGNVTKTVSLTFPPQGATTTRPVGIKFLPDGIQDLAVSPNGANVLYLLQTATGVRGFVAAPDGTASRELFTLPLSEVLVSWPSQNTALAYTKSALGVSGIAFSVSISNGAVVPLLHAAGLTLIADPTYSYIVYQTVSASGPATYTRDTEAGVNTGLSFNPSPERCVWGKLATSTLYCAASLDYVSPNYLGLWHAGSATANEALLAYIFPGGRSAILAIPEEEGGTASTIDSIAVSPDEKYMVFVRRGDRSLWGVRIQ